MNSVDEKYVNIVNKVRNEGVKKMTRSGEVISTFGIMEHFNLKEGLPILTTKKVFSRGCIEELLWFLSGDTNIKYLVDRNVHIWDDDAFRHYNTMRNYFRNAMFPEITKEQFIEDVKNKKRHFIRSYFHGLPVPTTYTSGDLGPVYGASWRRFGRTHVDQIQNIIDTLRMNPDDRRMLCVAFNPEVLDEVALPPCHVGFQFYTKPTEDGKRELSCLWTQRSVDVALGFPYNLLSYSVLTHMVAQCCDMEVGEVICSLGDTHIYMNQMDGIEEQLKNDPHKYDLPVLKLNPEIKDIDKFRIEDIVIENYNSYGKISFPLSVG